MLEVAEDSLLGDSVTQTKHYWGEVLRRQRHSVKKSEPYGSQRHSQGQQNASEAMPAKRETTTLGQEIGAVKDRMPRK